MRTLLFLPALALVIAGLPAQQAVLPVGLASVEGNSATTYPWSRIVNSTRVQYVYDPANFTMQSLGSVVITRVKWREDGNVNSQGSVYTNVAIDMSSSARAHTALSTTFADNHGPDQTRVYTGTVTTAPGSSAPGPWYVDIPLQTPFFYDPSVGSGLLLDVSFPFNSWTGNVGSVDMESGANARCSRVANGNNIGAELALTGAYTANVGAVMQIDYVPGPGAATNNSYGLGCYDRAMASFYQAVGAGTFNLSNSSIVMTPSGSGYAVAAGGTQWWTPTGANLGLGDDAVTGALPLGFLFPYPGGSTNSLWVASNGFAWLQANTDVGCCSPVPERLLYLGPRICPLWVDLDPGTGGTVVFDTDAPHGAAYATWTNVPEYGTSNLNTVQLAFFASGAVEMRWRACSLSVHSAMVGWSPGIRARDPGSTDLTTAVPFVTAPDQYRLMLTASPRPLLGNAVSMNSTQVPVGAPFGITVFGVQQFTPGLDLGTLGMPGCRQYAGIDVTQMFFPVNGGGSNAFFIPNNPLFTATHLFVQSIAFVPGINLLGVISSNGVDVFSGTH